MGRQQNCGGVAGYGTTQESGPGVGAIDGSDDTYPSKGGVASRKAGAGQPRRLQNVVRNTLTMSELYPAGVCPLCFALCKLKSYQISSKQQNLLISSFKGLAGVI